MEAKDSKCWTCKWGICLKESAEEKLLHKGMHDIDEDEDFEHEMIEFSKDEGIIEHTVSQEHVKAICFWRPEGVTYPTSPILVAFTHACNRYEKQ